jgi:hypothetical protein
MNKIVILNGWEFVPDKGILTMNDLDNYILETYGMSCINCDEYRVEDEYKFTLFMFTYPEYIEKISYE